MGLITLEEHDMILPWPTYDRLGEKTQSHFCARVRPKSGIAKITGKKYAASWIKKGTAIERDTT